MPAPARHPVSRDLNELYVNQPPWDIGRPQPSIARLADTGAIQGRVLDVGCGTGEHTLLAAALGLDATGIDLADNALNLARKKAERRGLKARFLHHDVRRLPDLGQQYDTVLDSLVFHSLAEGDRTRYLHGLQDVVRPQGRVFLLCFSDDQPTGVEVPHTLNPDQIQAYFTTGWRVDSIEPTIVESSSPQHAKGIAAWLVAITRTAVAPQP